MAIPTALSQIGKRCEWGRERKEERFRFENKNSGLESRTFGTDNMHRRCVVRYRTSVTNVHNSSSLVRRDWKNRLSTRSLPLLSASHLNYHSALHVEKLVHDKFQDEKVANTFNRLYNVVAICKIWTYVHNFAVAIYECGTWSLILRPHLVQPLGSSQHFMEPEGSLPSSQELTTCTYPEPNQSSPQHSLLFLKDPS
jgi:hypothetical protein